MRNSFDNAVTKRQPKKVIYYLKYAVALKNVELVYVNLPVNP